MIRDEIYLGGEILQLALIDGHSGIKFLDCEVRNFGKGIFVHLRTGHSMFEIRNCKFTNVVNPIYFYNTTATNLKITDCKFIDCYDSIAVLNDSEEYMYKTCDIVLIDNCTFSGNKMNYPIHFGGFVKVATLAEGRKVGLAATHVTVKGCEVVGFDRWWWQVPRGSADQIALYNVEHFSVTDNISRNGGDCGVIIQDGLHGTISGNTCIGNFGPGICITTPDPCFIHVNGNVSKNNCRRYKLTTLVLQVNDL